MWLNIDLATRSGKPSSPPTSHMRSENEGIETGAIFKVRGQTLAQLRRERLAVESPKGQESRVSSAGLWIELRECDVRHGVWCARTQRNRYWK